MHEASLARAPSDRRPTQQQHINTKDRASIAGGTTVHAYRWGDNQRWGSNTAVYVARASVGVRRSVNSVRENHSRAMRTSDHATSEGRLTVVGTLQMDRVIKGGSLGRRPRVSSAQKRSPRRRRTSWRSRGMAVTRPLCRAAKLESESSDTT